MVFGNPMAEIALVSLAVVSFSQLLQRKMGSMKAMRESQEKIKEKQKKMKELVGKEDKQSKAELEKIQKEMFELMGASMRGTMKHMMVTLPVFLVVFAALSFTYSSSLINLPFPLPIIHRNFSFEITSSMSWLWWYIYTSLVMSLIINAALKTRGK